jgi:large subunit ribosomal protein L6
VKGDILTMNLGYSNDISVFVPKGLSVTADANGKVVVSGIDSSRSASSLQIRKLRLPEPYKGKGIRYEDETIRRKVGKSGVK